MLKNKRIVQIIKMLVSCVISIISAYTNAEVTYAPVELNCSSSPMKTPWLVIKGTPRIQYTLATKGLREDGKEAILEVANVDGAGKTSSGLFVYVEARCISSNEEVNISLTDDFIACNVGDGLIVRMREPNNIDPDKYHYVGVLTIIRDEKKMLEVINNNATTVSNSEQQPQFNNKLSFLLSSK